MDSLAELNRFMPNDDITIKWLKMPDDFDLFCEHLSERGPLAKDFTVDVVLDWERQGITYCGLLKKGKMVARSAVERYLPDKWETADVRVWASERGNGYARQICCFVTKFILENNKTATCRTEDYNIPMQHVINALGFKKVGFVSNINENQV